MKYCFHQAHAVFIQKVKHEIQTGRKQHELYDSLACRESCLLAVIPAQENKALQHRPYLAQPVDVLPAGVPVEFDTLPLLFQGINVFFRLSAHHSLCCVNLRKIVNITFQESTWQENQLMIRR